MADYRVGDQLRYIIKEEVDYIITDILENGNLIIENMPLKIEIKQEHFKDFFNVDDHVRTCLNNKSGG